MDDEQYKRVVDALVEFVIRVANKEATTEKEAEVLPAVASILLSTRDKNTLSCDKLFF